MSNQGYTPFQGTAGFGSEFNAQELHIRSILAGVHTATLVQVVSCTNTGGVTPVGTVVVQPLVNQVDGNMNGTPHLNISGLPYFRLQGGTNAVIIDPQPGDIGIAIFCDRDTSLVRTTKAQANPGTARTFSMSDGLYIGGFLNGTPVQYVEFNASGITINSPNAVTVTAPNTTVNSTTTTVNASTSATVVAPTTNIQASSTVAITSPTVTMSGNLTVTGSTTTGSLVVL
jgi:hypothetical protein